MPRNRLRLDFSLETTAERLKFLDSYLPTIKFEPDDHEIETLSDYILWGKNKDGLNAQQEGITTLKEWAPSQVDSIEGLIEQPGFQETRLKSLEGTHYSARRVVFDRKKALQEAENNPTLTQIFKDLFRQIDTIEITINYYDLQKGKRKTPPRAKLLSQFTTEEQQHLQEKAAALTQRQYLKMRHRLVELRTEQYTYRDSVVNTIMPHPTNDFTESKIYEHEKDIEILPFGVHDGTEWGDKVFSLEPDPNKFTEQDLRRVTQLLWKEKNTERALDFENPDHILILYRQYHELELAAQRDPKQHYSRAAGIFMTLKYYEKLAKLDDKQRDILYMKRNKFQNVDIAAYINGKYNTTYNDNYISTIYRQKVLPMIAQAATLHYKIMQNIFYPEEFKKCRDCGRLLWRSADFFMRQRKAPDGFAPRCKACSRIRRREERRRNAVTRIITRADRENGAT